MCSPYRIVAVCSLASALVTVTSAPLLAQPERERMQERREAPARTGDRPPAGGGERGGPGDRGARDSDKVTGKDKAPDFVVYPEEPAITYHTATIGGESVHYEAKAGTITLTDRKYEPTAKIFFISYRRLNGPGEVFKQRLEAFKKEHENDPDAEPPTNYPDAATRPLTFSFNGGPGSSSVWLHLGIFGPKRVNYADALGNPGPPPYAVVPNEASVLDKSDFCFIDPVSTGFSRAEDPDKAKDFHGVEPDLASVAEFIRRFISREERWRSPKFIAGESYGTTRAAGLVQELNNQHGIAVNGVILVSAVLYFQTLSFAVGNDLPYVLFLPTYTATAHHHGRLPARLQQRPLPDAVREAEVFAQGDYAAALMAGDTLTPERAGQIAQRLAEYTGLSRQFIERANLRVDMGRFAKELLRDQRKTVGRFDSRFTGIDRDSAGERYEYDASYSVIRSNYTHSFNAYVREELEFESDLPYEILTNVRPWSYEPSGVNQYLNTAERLRSTMHQHPFMRVFLACGYHDLATPHFAAIHTVNHMQLAPEVRGNVTVKEYIGGHMMYLDAASRAAMRRDLVEFYSAVPVGGAAR